MSWWARCSAAALAVAFFELLLISLKLVTAVSGGIAALQTWAMLVSVTWLWASVLAAISWLLDRTTVRRLLPAPMTLAASALFGVAAAVLSGVLDHALYLDHPEFPREVARLSVVARVLVFALAYVMASLAAPWVSRAAERAHPGRVSALVLGSAALVVLWTSHFALDPLHEVGLAGGSTLAALGCLSFSLAALRWPSKPSELKLLVGVGAVTAILGASVPGAAREHARFVLWGHSTVAGLAQLSRRALDWDRDAVLPGWLFGGGDCAAGDRNVSPLQIEVAGDGIDQDCRGGDAKKTTAARGRATLPPACANLPARPDVIVVAIDALRADALRSDIMPAVSELAKGALRFSRAYAPTAMTLTSVPAIFSGMPFADVGPQNALLDENLTPPATLAEAFRSAGYRTIAISEFFEHAVFRRGFQRINRYWHDTPVRGVKGSLTSASMSAGVLAELEQAKGPALVWVHLADTHARYPLDRDREGQVAEPVAYYRGASYVDRQLGQLLTALQEGGRLQRTLIAITADHGEELLARGRQGHGPSVFEESVHVPLVLWVPGCDPRSLTRPVSTSRLAPSLAALAGVEFAGLGLFEVNAAPVVVEAVTGLETTYKRAVIDERYKLMLDVTNGGRLLFDLQEDPQELTNILAEAPQVAARLDAAYQRWLDSPRAR